MKRSDCRRDAHSSSDSNNELLQRTFTTVDIENSEEIGTASRQPCAAITADVRGAASPSTSPEVLITTYISISSSDEDTEVVCLSDSRRKTRACRRDRESSSKDSNSPSERCRKHVKCTFTTVDIESSEEIGTDFRQPCAAITADVRGAASPSTSPEVLITPYISISSSDEDPEIVCLSDRRRKTRACRRDRESSSKDSNSPSEPQRKGVKRLHTYAEGDSLLQTPEAEVQQIVSNGGRGYESEPEVHDDNVFEREGIPVQESTVYFSAESSGNSDWEIFQETERLQEVCTSRLHTGATGETEVRTEEGGTSTASVGGAASPSTSPEAVLPAPDVSSSSSDDDSEKCPICFATFAAQEVGTPNTCDHLFCMGCLKGWSVNANTCPVDRQEFNVILVRHYPKGEVIRRIPVRQNPVRNESGYFSLLRNIFCSFCGETYRQGRMIICSQCTRGYHMECFIPPLEAIPMEQWICPTCVAINNLSHGLR
jgi:hypothetical protein